MPIGTDPKRLQQQLPSRLWEGTVLNPVTDDNGWLRVEVESQPGVAVSVPWVPRMDMDTLPGDAVVVEESDEGNYWCVAWWPQNGQVSVPPSGTLTPATTTLEGIVRLSHAPADPLHPIAVEDTDPRNSNARTPTAHSHPESDVTNLVADLAAKEVKTAKGAANGYAPLDSGLLVPVANLPGATTLAKGIVQLAGDLAGSATAPTVPGLATKENTANKGVANGYAPLDASSKVPVANLPTTSGVTFTTGTRATRPAANTVVTGSTYYATDNGITYRADATANTWTAVDFTALRVTALPTSPTPEDGQLIDYAADATNGVRWPFRYNAGSASTFKWEAVGSPTPIYAVASFSQTVGASFAWSDPGATAPTINAPLAGDYDVECSGHSFTTSGAIGETAMSIGGTGPDSSIWFFGSNQRMPMVVAVRKTGLAVSAVIRPWFRSGTGSAAFTHTNYVLRVRPVRVG